jgi:hypothetical protein
MHVERLRPTTLRLTIHAFEPASLIAAARWAAEGGKGELTAEAIDQLRNVLDNYDTAWRQLNQVDGEVRG